MVVPCGFEPQFPAPKAGVIDRYTTGLLGKRFGSGFGDKDKLCLPRGRYRVSMYSTYLYLNVLEPPVGFEPAS